MKAINHKKHNQKVLCMVSVLFILIFTLSGCAKCISTETTTVQVKITDEYHRSMYVIPVYNGKTTTLVTHPAEYRITVEYDGIEYVTYTINILTKLESIRMECWKRKRMITE